MSVLEVDGVCVCAGWGRGDRRADHIPPRKEGSCWDFRCPWASLVLARELAEGEPLGLGCGLQRHLAHMHLWTRAGARPVTEL